PVRGPQPGDAAGCAVEQHLTAEDREVSGTARGVGQQEGAGGPFVVHKPETPPDVPSNRTWPLKTVRSVGLSPEVPAISRVPGAEPLVTHSPNLPLGVVESNPSNSTSPLKFMRLLGWTPEACAPPIGVSSKAPVVVPFVSHSPR